MTDLTEKLEAGRSYYVRYPNGSIEIDTAYEWIGKRGEHFIDFDEDNSGDEQALAPVPSYEELQELKEENARLKKLIQQWQEIHKHMVKYHGYINHSEFHPTFIETEKFIDEVHHADTTRK